MYRIFKAIRRLWIFAFCDHHNLTTKLEFLLPDAEFMGVDEIVFCRGCGRMLSFTSDSQRENNPHLLYPLMDYTRAERRKIIKSQKSHCC
jgi:hypothetical protein